MDENSLLVRRDGTIVRLTLNRPAAANGIDVPLARAILESSVACAEDESVRCVVLTGAGKLFCGGGDLRGFQQSLEELPVLMHQLTACLHTAIARLARMNKPLVVGVNGAAAGAGLSLAALGDVVLAARSAKFALAYTDIGLSPDGGSTWLLPRLIGMRRVQEMALLGTRLSAVQAAEIGLVTRVVDDAALDAELESVARKLAEGPTRAIGRTRNLFRTSFANSLEEQMELEVQAIADSARDAESWEGIAAYFDKRRPDFAST